jgi:hypothetical protein
MVKTRRWSRQIERSVAHVKRSAHHTYWPLSTLWLSWSALGQRAR